MPQWPPPTNCKRGRRARPAGSTPQPGRVCALDGYLYAGAGDLGRYAWQVAIPDLGAFLAAIVPELEIGASAAPQLATWHGDLGISLHRSAATLHIAAGCIKVFPGTADSRRPALPA
ncbi:MAG: hypothetical protein U0X20_11355 [Caldilineaceae bacterium]